MNPQQAPSRARTRAKSAFQRARALRTLPRWLSEVTRERWQGFHGPDAGQSQSLVHMTTSQPSVRRLFDSCTATLVCTILMLAHDATVSLPCTGTTYPRPICLARDAAVSLLPCSTWLPRQTRNHVSSRFYHSGPHFTHQHTDHDAVNH